MLNPDDNFIRLMRYEQVDRDGKLKPSLSHESRNTDKFHWIRVNLAFTNHDISNE